MGWYRLSLPKAVTAFLIDALGYIVFAPVIFARAISYRNAFQPSSILLLRPDHMGDVLMATPAIVALKRLFPRAHITVVVREANCGLISLPGTVDRVVGLDVPWVIQWENRKKQWFYLFKKIRELRKEKFDLAIELKGDLRNIVLIFLLGSKLRIGYAVRGGGFLLTRRLKFSPGIRHEAERNLDIVRSLGGNAKQIYPHYEVAPEKEIEIKKRIEKIFPQRKKLIGIHPGANSPSKMWLPSSFAELIDRIERERLGDVIIFAGPADMEIIRLVKIALFSTPVIMDNLLFEDLAAFFKELDIFIGNDSGPFHLAEAVGTKVITIFGSTYPEIVGPISRNSEIIRSRRNCAPCRRPGEKERCGEISCLKDISVEEVYEAVRRNLI